MAQQLFREAWNHKSQVRVSCRFHIPSKPLVSSPVSYPGFIPPAYLWFHTWLHTLFHTPGFIPGFIPVVSYRFQTGFIPGFIPVLSYLWFHTCWFDTAYHTCGFRLVSYPGPYPVSYLWFHTGFMAYTKKL
eukprot:9821841-Heterocapsa_arctica.AAC.1